MTDVRKELEKAGTRGATEFSGFGRLAVDPKKLADVAKKSIDIVSSPIMAFGRMWDRGGYIPGEQDDQGIKDAFEAASVTMGLGSLRVFAGRAAGELGATATQILQRSDAQKIIAAMKSEGKTARQIADALNERFAPMLDEGEIIRGSQSRIAAGPRAPRGETELGAMGGGGRIQGPRITAEDVVRVADELNLGTRVKGSSRGTEYVKVFDEAGPVNQYGKPKTVEVRIPAADKPHGGVGRRDQWQIDTHAEGPRNLPHHQRNVAGEAFQDNLPAVRDRLAYVFGKEPKTTPAKFNPTEEVVNDPRQLKLLTGGVMVDPQMQVERQENWDWIGGKLMTDDDRMLAESRRLRGEMRDAADDVPHRAFDYGQAMARDERQRWAEYMADPASYPGAADRFGFAGRGGVDEPKPSSFALDLEEIFAEQPGEYDHIEDAWIRARKQEIGANAPD